MAVTYDGILVQGEFPLTLPADVPASTEAESVHLLLNIVVSGINLTPYGNALTLVEDEPVRAGSRYLPCAGPLGNRWNLMMGNDAFPPSGGYTVSGLILFALPGGATIDVVPGASGGVDRHSLGGNFHQGNSASAPVLWGCLRQVRGLIGRSPFSPYTGIIAPLASYPYDLLARRVLSNGTYTHLLQSSADNLSNPPSPSSNEIDVDVTRARTNALIVGQSVMHVGSSDGTALNPVVWTLDDTVEYDLSGTGWAWSAAFGVKEQSTPFALDAAWGGPGAGSSLVYMTLNGMALEPGDGPLYCPRAGIMSSVTGATTSTPSAPGTWSPGDPAIGTIHSRTPPVGGN